ncbi:unnamed protein product [Vitrella brassicaformis CCMP3155]|uniref:Uncharacterized protein n=3 Tax=Vitrella brassicaformis TaxID=1169539 RepID=A0A0G4H3F9_VITBC|nr:unnamed protein product [Vitrella brassicaformis CCMP3155]|eukprot:CEM38000.1 unnamed protein product [Vitrella brassicaformis CCMP3155]
MIGARLHKKNRRHYAAGRVVSSPEASEAGGGGGMDSADSTVVAGRDESITSSDDDEDACYVGDIGLQHDVFNLSIACLMGAFGLTSIGRPLQLSPFLLLLLTIFVLTVQISLLFTLDPDFTSALGFHHLESGAQDKSGLTIDTIIDRQIQTLLRQSVSNRLCAIFSIGILLIMLAKDIRERAKSVELLTCLSFPKTETFWGRYSLKARHPAFEEKTWLTGKMRPIGMSFLFVCFLVNVLELVIDFWIGWIGCDLIVGNADDPMFAVLTVLGIIWLSDFDAVLAAAIPGLLNMVVPSDCWVIVETLRPYSSTHPQPDYTISQLMATIGMYVALVMAIPIYVQFFLLILILAVVYYLTAKQAVTFCDCLLAPFWVIFELLQSLLEIWPPILVSVIIALLWLQCAKSPVLTYEILAKKYYPNAFFAQGSFLDDWRRWGIPLFFVSIPIINHFSTTRRELMHVLRERFRKQGLFLGVQGEDRQPLLKEGANEGEGGSGGDADETAYLLVEQRGQT